MKNNWVKELDWSRKQSSKQLLQDRNAKEDSCGFWESMEPAGFPEVIILHFTTIALNGLSLNPWTNLNYAA